MGKEKVGRMHASEHSVKRRRQEDWLRKDRNNKENSHVDLRKVFHAERQVL